MAPTVDGAALTEAQLRRIVEHWNERFQREPGSPALRLSPSLSVQVLTGAEGSVVANLSASDLHQLHESMQRLEEAFQDAA